MTKRIKLAKNITEKEFDNGYWYADEIKVLTDKDNKVFTTNEHRSNH